MLWHTDGDTGIRGCHEGLTVQAEIVKVSALSLFTGMSSRLVRYNCIAHSGLFFQTGKDCNGCTSIY